jgi:hypothetical protein
MLILLLHFHNWARLFLDNLMSEYRSKTSSRLINQIERLTGQRVPLDRNISTIEKLNENNLNLGYSQLNELMLFLGYDRVSQSYFQFLVDKSLEFSPESTIKDVGDFAENVDKMIVFSLRLFGNIKFGFKKLSAEKSEEDFHNWYYLSQPIPEEHFTKRHKPLLDLKKIPNDETYYLGYIIQDQIKTMLAQTPKNKQARDMKRKMEETQAIGIQNHFAYLASDHMDVYVATSMRQRHEYLFISRTTDEIFSHSELKRLKIRYFDPTQAYCFDRVDKGISEALMLKRAQCTIYLAQESDTLGKDSELASTLAQGKTVVAYIPNGDKRYVDGLLQDLTRINPRKSQKELVIEQLKIFDPDLAWNDEKTRNWIKNDRKNETFGLNHLYTAVKRTYDKRAKTLKETHPLGIQVNLDTGVANGVIVTREIDECARLVRRVLKRELEFEVVEETKNQILYTYLKESITKSIYRVSTGEKLLTNTFWNYYLQ